MHSITGMSLCGSSSGDDHSPLDDAPPTTTPVSHARGGLAALSKPEDVVDDLAVHLLTKWANCTSAVRVLEVVNWVESVPWMVPV